jgi:3-oxoacyl-[acyl-carrier protein] reductase
MLGAGPVIASTTAKAGLMHFTRSLAKDLAPYMRVNAVAPGTIDTDMTRAAGEGCIASVVQTTPFERLGRAEEVAAGVVF